ncbi:MAG: signal peptidase I [Candidatus Pacearchaeota archaeon]
MPLKKEIKSYYKKFWDLLWNDDSFKGWLFSIIVIFVFIRFIFFPLLIFLTGTPLPLAIVESCSMYHDGNLLSDTDSWWEENANRYSEFSINKTDFDGFPMKKGLNKGDILFIVGANTDNLDVGDIIVFNTNQKTPIIHRIIKIEESNGRRVFSTMGDDVGHVQFFEEEIRENQIVGKAVFKAAPYLGWIKLAFFEWQRPNEQRGLC